MRPYGEQSEDKDLRWLQFFSPRLFCRVHNYPISLLWRALHLKWEHLPKMSPTSKYCVWMGQAS